jgi:hypothetical protein
MKTNAIFEKSYVHRICREIEGTEKTCLVCKCNRLLDRHNEIPSKTFKINMFEFELSIL